MSASELPGAIHDLASEVVEKLGSENPQTIEEPWIRRKYVTFGSEKAGGYISHTQQEEFSKESWDNDDIDKLIELMRDTKIYKECIDLISRRTDDEFEDTEDVLEEFILDIIERSTEPLSDRELTNRVSVFVSELDDSPVYWEGNCWIDGINVVESIRLTEEISLRPPTEEDLMDEYPARFQELGGRSHPRNGPRTILKFSTRTNKATDVDLMRTNILNTLLLFDIASISEIRWSRQSEGLRLRSQGSPEYYRYDISRERMSYTPFGTEVSKEDGNSIREFYGIMAENVFKHIQQADEDYLTIAFDRFQSAISDDDSDESRLTSSIMALEALLLGAEGELADKLSRRTGTLLGIYDHNPIEVYNKVKEAYNVRSDYVHGSKIDYDISDLAERIANYARMVLIIELQIHTDLEKTSLLSKLDKSGLHDEARDNFIESLEDLVELAPNT